MSSADALHQRGLDALNAKNFALAVELFTQAIARDPRVARYFVNRGQAFRSAGQDDRASEDFRSAIQLDPGNAIAHHNLGVVLRANGNIEGAIEHYLRAIQIKPDYAKAHYNLANALRLTGQLAEAQNSYREAIRLQPEYPEAWNNLGELLEELREVDEALVAVSKAIELRPTHAGAHFNRGFLNLLRGNFAEGWRDYEWRFAATNLAPPATTIPVWTGEDLRGKSILLVSEQGAGDTVQFIRFAKTLSTQGAKVIVRTGKILAKLVRSVPGVSEVNTDEQPIPQADFYIPILSIPSILRTTLDAIPREIPYMTPDPADVERWRARMEPHRRALNIGLSWAGNPVQPNDRNRSAPLSALKALGELEGASIFSLQKGVANSQIAASGVNLIDLSDEIQDFSDTAAIIANLDVVVTVCTSVAHIAGAMGKKTLAMLCFNADWRWMLDREDSPWYPTMKLFRQKSQGDWSEVASRVRDELVR